MRYESTLRAPRKEAPKNDLATMAAKIMANGHAMKAIRSPETFAVKMKSKDAGKFALALAKHCFARYPTPAHLDAVWYPVAALAKPLNAPVRLDAFDKMAWWMTVAQGGSLHKAHTSAFFTRKESHVFLNPPVAMSFEEALWYAVARSHTDDHGLAFRVAKSRLSERHKPDSPFWKDTARFFVVNKVALNEINDLLDYLAHRYNENKEFNLKGRTLPSLRNQMHQWHRDLQRIRRIGVAKWEGLPIEPWNYEQKGAKPHLDVVWTVKQITESVELQKEGNAMRHCVLSYKNMCVSGRCGIFSVRRRGRMGEERVLTIEVTSGLRIVQVRGFANRIATGEEAAIVNRWAQQRGLQY